VRLGLAELHAIAPLAVGTDADGCVEGTGHDCPLWRTFS
jgi:hypothetical protein